MKKSAVVFWVLVALLLPFGKILYFHCLAKAEQVWPPYIELSKEDKAELANVPTPGGF